MNHYEVMYIIDAMVDDQNRAALIERFSNVVSENGGSVTRVDEWGMRKLAYAINYKTQGYYVLMFFDGPSALPRELERNLQINENILRHVVFANDGKLPAKKVEAPRPAAAAAPAAPAQVVEIEDATDDMLVETNEAE